MRFRSMAHPWPKQSPPVPVIYCVQLHASQRLADQPTTAVVVQLTFRKPPRSFPGERCSAHAYPALALPVRGDLIRRQVHVLVLAIMAVHLQPSSPPARRKNRTRLPLDIGSNLHPGDACRTVRQRERPRLPQPTANERCGFHGVSRADFKNKTIAVRSSGTKCVRRHR